MSYEDDLHGLINRLYDELDILRAEKEALTDVANWRLCSQATDTVFNINFKAVRVCESCAAAITMQNVTDLCQKARK